MSEFHIDSEAASGAIASLLGAAARLNAKEPPRSGAGFESLTGIADDVELYLRGVHVARAALADAATTAGRSIRELMDRASALDGELSAALDADYAVRS